MSKSKSSRFTGTEEEIRRDLRDVRKALMLGKHSEYLNFFKNLSVAGLADLRLESSANGRGGMEYTLRWAESGRIVTHRGAAEIGSGSSGPSALILSDFPKSLTPLALLSGNFYSSRTIEYEVELPEEGSLRLAASDQADDWQADRFRLAGDSGEDFGGLAAWDSPFALSADSGDEDDEEDEDEEIPELSAAGGRDELAPAKPEFLVNWSGKDQLLTIQFTPQSAAGLPEEIPIVITQEFTDKSGASYGSHHDAKSKCYVAPIFGHLKSNGAGSGTWFFSVKAKRRGAEKGFYPPVKIKMCSSIPEEVVCLGGEDEDKRLVEVNAYLATKQFKACTGTVGDSKARFVGFPDKVISKDDLLIRIVRNTEAKTEDVGPFDAVWNALIELQSKLINNATWKLEFWEAGSYADAKEIVGDLTAKLIAKFSLSETTGQWVSEYWQKIWDNKDVDAKGPRGGSIGVRRKIWNRLRGDLTNFRKKLERHNTIREADFADPKKSSLRDMTGLAHPPRADRQRSERSAREQKAHAQRSELDKQLVYDHLSDREQLVWPHFGKTDGEIVAELRIHFPRYTLSNARTDRNKIVEKLRIHRSLKCLLDQTSSKQQSLSPIEYEILVRSYLDHEQDCSIQKALGLTSKKDFKNIKSRVDLIVATTIAIIDLHIGAKLDRKPASENISKPKQKSELHAVGVIKLWEMEFLLDWLLHPNPLSVAEIACAKNRSEESVLADLKRLGAKVHAQLVINQGGLDKQSRDLLWLWIVKGMDLNVAVEELKVADLVKALKLICSEWETVESPVPPDYRILPRG